MSWARHVAATILSILVFISLNDGSAGDTGDNIATQVVGDIRLQALALDVIRIERRGLYFEDNATFMVQNRNLNSEGFALQWSKPIIFSIPIGKKSVSAFNITLSMESNSKVLTKLMVVSTPAKRKSNEQCWVKPGYNVFPARQAANSIYVQDAGACCNACSALDNCSSWVFTNNSASMGIHEEAMSTCNSTLNNVDITKPNIISHQQGQNLCGATVENCCKYCDNDSTCSAFVLSPPSSWAACPHKPYCFLLKSYGTTVSKANSVFGHKGKLPPPPPPTPKPNCRLLAGYGELNPGTPSEIFGCPRSGCDSAWSGRWQGGDLGATYRDPAPSLTIYAFSSIGDLLGSTVDVTAPFTFPSPSSLPTVFAIRDSPRIIVPPGGAIPQGKVPPALSNTSGYDVRNQADDIYMFIRNNNPNHDYIWMKKKFLDLVGHTPLLPDWAFGTWFTEWHSYHQNEAEVELARWAARSLPLSVWGLDVNWRKNGFGGNNCTWCEYYYNQTNTTLLPNITGLFDYEHKQGLRVYFNDHPYGFAPETSPEELRFRYDGLVSHLSQGLDFWWYDPNWHIGIPAPFNLEGAIWGAHVYTSVLTKFLENKQADRKSRPIMLGISDSQHPVAHRYPIWWTGDDKGLGFSITSMVDLGVSALKPYVHSDCGGVANKATGLVDVAEYVRWSQHCALGAIHRYHGGPGHQPWLYNNTVESIIRRYLSLRMALMPTYIAAGTRASADGTPIARRLDITFPNAGVNATRSDQYLLADDILVAPCDSWEDESGTSIRDVWIPPGEWQDVWTGAITRGPLTMSVTQPLDRVPMFHRRPGLVVTAPVAQTIDEQNWTNLTLDVFPVDDEDHFASLQRSVVRQSEKSVYTISLNQTAKSTVLQISCDPITTYVVSWVVRVNLKPRQTLAQVLVNNKISVTQTIAPISPGADGFFPFKGPGSPPASQAGNVEEIMISTRTASPQAGEPIVIEIMMK